MILTLNEKKQKELRSKAVRKAIKEPVIMSIMNAVIALLGIAISYYAYLKLGIDCMTNLICFILGVTLSVIGIEKFLSNLCITIERGVGSGKWSTNVYYQGIYRSIPLWVESLKLELKEKGIQIIEKCSIDLHCLDMQCSDGEKTMDKCLPWSEIKVFCYKNKNEVHIHRFMDSQLDIRSSVLILSDRFNDFDYNAVVEEFKKYLPENRVVFVDTTNPLGKNVEKEETLEEAFGEKVEDDFIIEKEATEEKEILKESTEFIKEEVEENSESTEGEVSKDSKKSDEGKEESVEEDKKEE